MLVPSNTHTYMHISHIQHIHTLIYSHIHIHVCTLMHICTLIHTHTLVNIHNTHTHSQTTHLQTYILICSHTPQTHTYTHASLIPLPTPHKGVWDTKLLSWRSLKGREERLCPCFLRAVFLRRTEAVLFRTKSQSWSSHSSLDEGDMLCLVQKAMKTQSCRTEEAMVYSPFLFPGSYT